MSNKYKLPVGALTDKDIKNAKNVADLRKAIKAGSLVGAGLISRKKKVVKKKK
jgi:translation elongation factor EF-4